MKGLLLAMSLEYKKDGLLVVRNSVHEINAGCQKTELAKVSLVS